MLHWLLQPRRPKKPVRQPERLRPRSYLQWPAYRPQLLAPELNPALRRAPAARTLAPPPLFSFSFLTFFNHTSQSPLLSGFNLPLPEQWLDSPPRFLFLSPFFV